MLQAAGPRTQPWQQQTVSQLPAGLSTPREGRQRTGRNKLRQEFLLDSRQYLNFLFCHGSGTLLGGRQALMPRCGWEASDRFALPSPARGRAVTPWLQVLLPQWLIRTVLVGWKTNFLHCHPWGDLIWESQQQRQHALDQTRAQGGTDAEGGHLCPAVHCHHHSPPCQALLFAKATKSTLAQSTGQPGMHSPKTEN